MKKIIVSLKKVKIGVVLITLAIMFIFGGCDNGTSPITEVLPHPDKIGMIGDVEIRASFAITPEQKADLMARLAGVDGLGHDLIANHANINFLKIIEITEFGTGNLVADKATGTLSGTVSGTDALWPVLGGGLNGFTVAHNATEEEMLLADLEERNAAAGFRIASRASEGIAV